MREFQMYLVKSGKTKSYGAKKVDFGWLLLEFVLEKQCRNNRLYSDKQKLNRECAIILTTNSPRHFPGDVRLLNASLGLLHGLSKRHICHFENYSLTRTAQAGDLNQRSSSKRSFVHANKRMLCRSPCWWRCSTPLSRDNRHFILNSKRNPVNNQLIS